MGGVQAAEACRSLVGAPGILLGHVGASLWDLEAITGP